jgi:hypothetical protein
MPFASNHQRGGRVVVEPLDAVRWMMIEPVRYIGETETFVVPAGYVTDFATVPRIAVWLIPRFGSYTKAAILHDWLLTDSEVSSVDADNLFRRALRELGVPPVRRTLMWVGVRWGAAFNKRRRAGWWRTAPAVLAYSAPALLLAPVFAAVAIGLAAYGIVEFAVSSVSPKDETTSGSLST